MEICGAPVFVRLPFKLSQGKSHLQIGSGIMWQATYQTAICQLKNNKSPGADGLVAEFYKSFSDEPAPFLLQLDIESLQNHPSDSNSGYNPSWSLTTGILIVYWIMISKF